MDTKLAALLWSNTEAPPQNAAVPANAGLIVFHAPTVPYYRKLFEQNQQDSRKAADLAAEQGLETVTPAWSEGTWRLRGMNSFTSSPMTGRERYGSLALALEAAAGWWEQKNQYRQVVMDRATFMAQAATPTYAESFSDTDRLNFVIARALSGPDSYSARRAIGLTDDDLTLSGNMSSRDAFRAAVDRLIKKQA